MMKIAVIDMGTNTFHLLLAGVENGDFKVLYKEKAAVRIGKGGISEGYITAYAESKALKALRRFKDIITVENVDTVFATATSAIRNAKNGHLLVQKIKERTGIEVRVIDGDQEAEYIYFGVQRALAMGDKPSLIMDIGGGSIEFIIGDHQNIYWKRSFEIGGQRLIDQFHDNDPITPIEVDNLKTYLGEQLQPLFEVAAKYDVDTLIGSSGTFDTLSDIYRIEHKIEKSPEATEFPLPYESFEKIADDIISKTREKRLEIPGMIEMRVDMAVVAVVLVKFVMEQLSLTNIRVSAYALKEGVLLSILQELQENKSRKVVS